MSLFALINRQLHSRQTLQFFTSVKRSQFFNLPIPASKRIPFRHFNTHKVFLKTYKLTDPSELPERIIDHLRLNLREYHWNDEDWKIQRQNILNIINHKFAKDNLPLDKNYKREGIVTKYVSEAIKELNKINFINELPSHFDIKDSEFSNVKNWSPKKVKQFLQEKLDNQLTAEAEIFFDEFQINGSDLLNLTSEITQSFGLTPEFDKELQKIIKSLNAKTIYIKTFDKKTGTPLESFEKHVMHDDNDLYKFLREVYGKGLELINNNDGVDPSEFILKSRLAEGNKWKQLEDKITEDETFYAIRNELPTTTVMHDRIIFGTDGNKRMEWDGILYSHEEAIFCEAKHKMAEGHLDNLIRRIEELKENERDEIIPPEINKGKTYIGAACGTYFPKEVQSKADEKGLISIFPSGNRYRVDIPDKVSARNFFQIPKLFQGLDLFFRNADKK
ncbi:hypothetical protein GLOIN_2v1571072 [Rhizophagus clarus]|uniref:Uncharacterized protein n=1 Tax=Rhizophagus clarus TaxID=94130 RepID=A0A8H3L454_9GLOM|nr:hypothetical protein GLOIN_2v1571072 [Rhizophagus clarus]